MNLENMKVKELDLNEQVTIDGGCPQCEIGDAIVEAGKFVLGFLAGIGDGIRDGIED